MRNFVLWQTAACLVVLIMAAPAARGQSEKAQPPANLLTRSITRHETARLQFGGTVTLSGAPAGSIVIHGWQRNEVEIKATIELQAPTAADLDLLATLNTFVVDQEVDHIRILTTGTHDRAFMKHATKKFPKALLGLPWKIDFQISLPAMTDLEVDAGVGPIELSGVEGALRLNALSSVADLELTGGLVSVLIQGGEINLRVPNRNWHGLGAEVRLASGKLSVELAAGFSGDLNADVLRTGEIRSTFPDLQPRSPNSIGPTSVRARAGMGGATLNFTVGDGTVEIKQIGGSSRQ